MDSFGQTAAQDAVATRPTTWALDLQESLHDTLTSRMVDRQIEKSLPHHGGSLGSLRARFSPLAMISDIGSQEPVEKSGRLSAIHGGLALVDLLSRVLWSIELLSDSRFQVHVSAGSSRGCTTEVEINVCGDTEGAILNTCRCS